MSEMPRMPYQEIEVIINGSDANIWNKWGLVCNPFPIIAKYEFNQFNRVLQKLDGDPIKSKEEMLEIVKGGAPWFIERCLETYEPGKRTRFRVKILTGD